MGPPSRRRRRRSLRRCTLDKLEERFGPLLASLAACTVPRRRERPSSVRRTLWCFLWQGFQGNVPCREVVRQLQAMLAHEGRRTVDENTSGYCQARARLPEPVLQAALKLSAAVAASRVPVDGALQGRPVQVLDGTTLTLPDSAPNQAAYPQPRSQRPGCGFPLLHLVVRWEARGAAISALAWGDHHHGEMRRLHQLGPTLKPEAIVIYDAAAGHYVAGAQVRARQADPISRVGTRTIDWRRGRRLGSGERLVAWPKSRQRPGYLTPEEWAAFPATLTVRLLRLRVQQSGFRTREIVLVTTLLDPGLYPAAEIAAAYLRRWRLEMCLDDLKTTLGLDALRCRTPAMVRREVLVLLLAHNLVRAVMAEAAQAHAVPLDQISFTGTLAAGRLCCAACAHVTRPAHHRRLWADMLRLLAADLVPRRPDRWEPRAVKRRPKSYPRLNRPRYAYRDTRHGGRFRRPKNHPITT